MKNKKLALAKSLLALLLCVAMLVSTTFAWFTDSVVSGINTIAAGNLDVELYHSNAVVTNQKVTANTRLFLDLQGNPILWEPGVVTYENLRVTNEGDLALIYQMAINTANENYILDNGARLSQALKVGVVEGGISATDRDGVVASVKSWTTLSAFLCDGSLLAGAEETWGVVIYWQPGDNDNYWNANNGRQLSSGDALSIDLGIKLTATQEQYENDSFGNDYDVSAKDDAFPSFGGGTAGSPIEVGADNRTTAAVTIAIGNITATIPAGVLVEEGTNELTLTIKTLSTTSANVVLSEDEAIRSLDVHVEGVSANNDTPITVTLPEVAPVALNMGNYNVYHVENGATNEMTLVASNAAFDAHNQYKYDPATGDVVLYMATFSEVALTAEDAKWEGGVDHSWYVDKTSPYTIANADQLWSFSQIVGGMAKDEQGNAIAQDSFEGKTITLIADIDLNDGEENNASDRIFYPIGYWNNEGTYERKPLEERTTAVDSALRNFCGTFDGNGHTIANFYHNTWEMKGDHNWYSAVTEQYYRDGMGLFGRVYGATIKNLTVDNFKSDGEIATTGVIAAYAEGSTFENIAVTNCNPRVYNIGNGGIVGCVGWYAKDAGLVTTFKNITVDNSNTISALWGSYDVPCGGIVGQYYPTSGQTSAGKPANAGIEFENCHISAVMDVNNDVCGNYQYYAYRYAGMLIGSINKNVTIDGHVYPDMTNISANDCTVHFGTWNDYYYCEFEKNGHPSYSGPDDYKFSRIPHSEIYFTDSNENGVIDTEAERASVTGCKHDHTAAEDNQCVYLPFNNLVTGTGWGVTTKVVGDLDGVKILDREVGDSVEKFQGKVTELNNNKTYKFGDIFSFVDNGVELIPGALTVAINNKDANNPVSATIVYDRDNWENSTITFTGIGEITITIQDYYFCTATTIDVTISERQNEVKFESKFTNTNFTYRVGNQNAVALSSLFAAKSGATIGTISVVIENVDGTANGTPSSNPTLSNGTIQFSGTGVAKVTIKDDDEYCTPTVLYLEVVEAVNATGASNATANNVVLLNDAGFSSLEVSNGYALYGNGFTLTCGSDSPALGFGYQFVTLDNGTLDNVQIVTPNFDYAALYKSQMESNDNRYQETDRKRYYNTKSAVAATGNSQILNSRISGGRAALNITNGNIVVDNSRLELGAVATVMISAANSVTFRDVVLVQKPTESTYRGADGNSPKTLMGMSVLYLCDADGNATPTTLEGSFVQYAWADASCAAYMPTGTSGIASTVLGKANYTHTINGKACVNLGFAYMPNDGTKVSEPNNITDNRDNKSTIPYAYESVNAEVPWNGLNVNVSTYVYSYRNSSGTNNAFANEEEYTPNKYSDIVAISYNNIVDGLTIGKTFGTNGWVYKLDVDLDKLSGFALDFSKLTMSVNGVTVENYLVNGSAKPGSPVTVTVGGTTYTLSATVNGKQCATTLIVTGVETSKRAPYLVDANNNEIAVTDISWGTYLNLKGKSGTSTVYGGAVPVLENVNIRYWDVNASQYITVSLKALTPAESGKVNGTNSYWEYADADGDYTLKIEHTENPYHSSGVYGMPVVYNNVLYFVPSATKGLVTSGSGARTPKFKYTFTDNNGGTLVFEKTWTLTINTSNTVDYSTVCGESSGSDNPCVTPDTLITLADGTQVRVDSLKGDEQLLVWNHQTGKLDKAPVAYIVNHNGVVENREVIYLNFANGKTVKIIGEHVFFDATLNKYVALDANAADYIGHEFLGLADNGVEKVELASVEKKIYETSAYEVVSYKHLTCFTNDMLSTSAFLDPLLNVFDINTDTFAYDKESVVRDIETYGLYTYADFEDLISEEAFELYDAQYLKIAIGKGYITWDDIHALIDIYFDVEVEPLQ